MKHLKLKDGHGFTLTETLMAIAILSVVSLAVGAHMVNMGNNSNRVREIGVRDLLVQNITKAISNYDFLENSAALAGNNLLRACLVRSNVEDCTITEASRQVPFSLGEFDSKGSLVKMLAGTSGNPVLYGDGGKPNCVPAPLNRCPTWKARAFFWARCGGGQAICSQATTVLVRFQVYPAVERDFRGAVPAAVPPEPDFSSPVAPLTLDAFAIPVPVRRILVKGQACPPGSRQTGFDSQGRITCECLPNTVKVGTVNDAGNILPICQIIEDRCRTGLYAVGKDPDGKVICKPPRVTSAGTVRMDSARCRTNAWLNSTSRGGCTVVSGGSRKANPIIVCGTNIGNCFIETTPP